jgi:type IV pilus assembly protein PilO
MDALLTDINQAGLGRGLQFELFRPAPQETFSEFYAELPINIRLSGSYQELGQFAADIARLPRIVTLNDISVSTGRDGQLSMEAVAKTFRYLDDNELAQQRKAAQAAPKKK